MGNESQKQRFLQEKKLFGRAGTPKKVKISHRGVGIRREKGGVSICTHKKLVDVSRRLVQIISLIIGQPRPPTEV